MITWFILIDKSNEDISLETESALNITDKPNLTTRLILSFKVEDKNNLENEKLEGELCVVNCFWNSGYCHERCFIYIFIM